MICVRFSLVVVASWQVVAQSDPVLVDSAPPEIRRMVELWGRAYSDLSAITLKHVDGADGLSGRGEEIWQICRYGHSLANGGAAISEYWDFRAPLPSVIVEFLSSSGGPESERKPKADALVSYLGSVAPLVIFRFVSGQVWEWRPRELPEGPAWVVSRADPVGASMIADYFKLIGWDKHYSWAWTDGWRGSWKRLGATSFSLVARDPWAPVGQEMLFERQFHISESGLGVSRIVCSGSFREGSDPGPPLVELVASGVWTAVDGQEPLSLPLSMTTKIVSQEIKGVLGIRYHLVHAGVLDRSVRDRLALPEQSVYSYPSGPPRVVLRAGLFAAPAKQASKDVSRYPWWAIACGGLCIIGSWCVWRSRRSVPVVLLLMAAFASFGLWTLLDARSGPSQLSQVCSDPAPEALIDTSAIPADAIPVAVRSHGDSAPSRSVSASSVVRGVVCDSMGRRVGGRGLGMYIEAWRAVDSLFPAQNECRCLVSDDGSFEISVARTGNQACLFVKADKWFSWGSWITPPEAGGEQAGGEIVLTVWPIDCTIEGVVRDPAGSPLSGARVQLNHLALQTDRLGLFTMSIPAVCTGSLVVSCPTYVGVEVALGKLEPGIAHFDVTLHPAKRLFCRMETATGDAIPGVAISCGPGRGGAVTDANGRFQLDADPKRNYFWAHAVGFPVTLFDYAHESADIQKFILSKGRTLRGRVVNQAGEAVSQGVVVAISRVHGGVAHLDSDGRFELRDVPAEVDSVFVRSRGFVPSPVRCFSREVDDAVVVVRRGRELRGRLIGAGGGVARANITMLGMDDAEPGFHEDVCSDDQGWFVVRDIDAAVSLRVSAVGYCMRVLTGLSADTANLCITLDEAGCLHGLVSDAVTGLPIPVFRLRLEACELRNDEVPVSWLPSAWFEQGVTVRSQTGVWSTATSGGGGGPAIGTVAALVVSAEGYKPETIPRVVVGYAAAPPIRARLSRGP